MIIRLQGPREYIESYLLSFQNIYAIETGNTLKKMPTITLYIVPTQKTKTQVLEEIIEDEKIPKPKTIVIEDPIEITEKIIQFSKNGGTIIIFRETDEEKIEIIQYSQYPVSYSYQTYRSPTLNKKRTK